MVVSDGIAQQLELGELTHVAIAVRSIEESIVSLACLGIAGWGDVLELDVPATHQGEERHMGLRAAFSAASPIPYELIEPTNGDSPIAAFLSQHGEGVQHVGYTVADLDGVLARAEAAGVPVDWLARDQHGAAVAFLSPDAFFGVSIELVRRTPPVSPESWKRHDA